MEKAGIANSFYSVSKTNHYSQVLPILSLDVFPTNFSFFSNLVQWVPSPTVERFTLYRNYSRGNKEMSHSTGG